MTQQENKNNFISALYIAKNEGFDIGCIYSQAYLETGNFTSSLCDDFNYFGIKTNSRWDIGVNKPTQEVDKGKIIDIHADFCKFGTQYTGITFYCEQIHRLYPDCDNNKLDYKKYFQGLQDGGWSTSPEYASNLIQIYERLKDTIDRLEV